MNYFEHISDIADLFKNKGPLAMEEYFKNKLSLQNPTQPITIETLRDTLLSAGHLFKNDSQMLKWCEKRGFIKCETP